MDPNKIIGEVATLTGIPVSAITGKRRTQGVIAARTLAFEAIRQQFPAWSQGEISEFMGRKDHSTTVYAKRRFANFCEQDRNFRQTAKELGLI